MHAAACPTWNACLDGGRKGDAAREALAPGSLGVSDYIAVQIGVNE